MLIGAICIHFCNVVFGEIQTLLEMRPPERTAFRNLGVNLRPILPDAFQANQNFGKQNAKHLLHQVLHCGAVGHSTCGVIHYLHRRPAIQGEDSLRNVNCLLK
jgi:hypothetical protein